MNPCWKPQRVNCWAMAVARPRPTSTPLSQQRAQPCPSGGRVHPITAPVRSRLSQQPWHRRAETTDVLVSRENGMPMSLSRSANGLFPAALLSYYAKLVTTIAIEEVRPSPVGHTIVRREPVGVVAAIVPWNYPQALAAFKLAPALAAGCTVVLKASPETALDALIFRRSRPGVRAAGRVLNVVPGAEAGAHLVSHPGVDKVSFTGSTAVGRIIGETCGRLLRPVTLELGGKSAAIILDDADLNATMRGLGRCRSSTMARPASSVRASWPRAPGTERSSNPWPNWSATSTSATLWTARPKSVRWSVPASVTGCSGTSKAERPVAPNWLSVGEFRATSPVAGSFRPLSSPTSTTQTGSPKKRSSALCWPSFPMTTTSRPSRWPMTVSSAWPAQCGPPMSDAQPRLLARFAPEPSASTATNSTSVRHSGGQGQRHRTRTGAGGSRRVFDLKSIYQVGPPAGDHS